MAQFRKSNVKLLILALISVLILSIGHAYSNQILLLGSLLLFAGVTLVPNKKYFLPIMLFYLPWSPVLKINPGTFTFFTLVVPFVFLLISLSDFKNRLYYRECIFVPLFFVAYTLLVKLLNGYAIDMSYLFFIMMLFFIPIYVNRYGKNIDFEACVLYLTVGVLSAGTAAKILMNFPHMLRYIDVYEWEKIGLTRLSGFYGDANFYSANILVTIASLLIVLYKTKNKTMIVLQIVSIMALLYYGMLSVSKMFILCVAGIAVLWVFSLVLVKRNVLYKIGMGLTILLVLVIGIASNLFSEQIELYLIRFGMVTDTQSLTTGRSGLFEIYINYLFSSIVSLFFGVGLSSMELVSTSASHNTLIQIIYQVGLLGSIFLIVWWWMVYSILSNKVKLRTFEKYYFLILIIAYFLPWLSLDMLYFDEFFYIILLSILAKNYITTYY
ncbi:hypothetical protein [Peribacillus huizhouensis]|uniref:O-antigen ligase domain-containing protein n=1 Tax=Peribacillus huizhouensis TaxID=1501239 RepID=A0ABR6CLR8_9BACI|nr:hypothetical protein [Peribacillus huizhouensis]MBA9025656.1 hypothetical protein [Peribacillus huizhouensis]